LFLFILFYFNKILQHFDNIHVIGHSVHPVVDMILILPHPKFYFNIPTSLCSRQKDLGRSIHTT